MTTDACPHCSADLRSEPIPQKYIDEGFYAPDATHYSRKLGVEVPGLYDGILFWRCPDCRGSWHRWTDPVMRARAAPYIVTPCDLNAGSDSPVTTANGDFP